MVECGRGLAAGMMRLWELGIDGMGEGEYLL